MKFFYFFIFISLNVCSVFAQQKKIDSLETVIKSAKQDTVHGKALSELCRIYIKTADTVGFMKAYDQLGVVAKKTKDPHMGNLYTVVRAVFEEKVKENKETALTYYLQSLDFCRQAKDKTLIAKRAQYVAKLFLEKGEYKVAVGYYYESIKAAEETGNKISVSYSYFGLGEVMCLQQNYKKAMEVYQRAYALAIETQDPPALLAGYNNMGMIYNKLEKEDSALSYYNKSLDYATKRNNQSGISNALSRISTIYMKHNEFEKAIGILKKCLDINVAAHDDDMVAACNINLTEAYYGLSKYKEAEEYGLAALELSKKIKLAHDEEYCYRLLGYIYKQEKKFEKSTEMLSAYTNLHDSIVNIQNNRLASEMEEKYQGEKKQKEIELLNKDKALKDVDFKKQKQFSFFITLVAILIGVTGFLIFLGLRSKQKDNKVLAEKNEIIHHQKEIVEEKNKEITDSITYAKRIQYALLANKDVMKNNLPPHFLFFNPKDIVSGDFYWATVHQNKFYLAICDSTGHGVPGAFMSLLNIGFLSEAINEKNITSPDKVHDHVRERLVNSISKEGQQDGFDGILLCVDLETHQLSYSAAYNAPVLVSGKAAINLPANKMPVGYGERKEPFDLFTISAKPGDRLFLFTDGYADQFGGPKGKKFLYKRFNDLLIAGSNLPLEEQKKAIIKEFEDWKGDLEQVDDICVIGIQL